MNYNQTIDKIIDMEDDCAIVEMRSLARVLLIKGTTGNSANTYYSGGIALMLDDTVNSIYDLLLDTTISDYVHRHLDDCIKINMLDMQRQIDDFLM